MTVDLDSHSPAFVFLTYGDVGSAAYNRAKYMGMELARRGFKVDYIVDRTPQNLALIESWQPENTYTHFVTRRPHLLGTYRRRGVLKRISSSNSFVVQLNPNLKAFVTLIGMRVNLIGEWDEPPILRDNSRIGLMMARYLHWWFLRKSTIKVSCSRYFQETQKDFAYIPHGYYLNDLPVENIEIGDYAAYMGNLQKPWDHDLVFSGALEIKERGLTPPIHIIGSGSEMSYWQKFCLDNNLNNIKFLGRLDDREMLKHLMEARLLLMPMRDTALNRSRCSSKLLAYAQAGRPVLAHRVGETTEILSSLMISIEPTAQIMGLVNDLLLDPSTNDKREVPDHRYSKRVDGFLDALGGLNQIYRNR